MSDTSSTTQVLARKWRPRELSALVGQEHVVRALRHALQTQRLHHAYLFTGTRGVGKTTLARILAKALNCETGITDTPCGQCNACREIDQGRFVDLLEVDAATNTGVDEMRELLENAAYAPTAGRYKVYVIDEVHMLSKSAFNAMLKTLEEPPPHMLFILATTDPQKIPVTVLSRCLQFNLKQMPPSHVVEHLQRVLAAEGIAFDIPALQMIGRAAQGSMRDALSLTDQAIAHGAGQLTQQSVQDMLGSVDQRHLLDILEALAAQDGAALLAVADDMANRSLPLAQALQNLASLLYRLSVAHLVPGAIAQDDPDRDMLQTLSQRFSPAQLQLYYQIASHGRRELMFAPDEATGFGMCLLRMLAFLPQTGAPAEQGAGAVRQSVASRGVRAEGSAAGVRSAQSQAPGPDAAHSSGADPQPDITMPAASAPRATPAAPSAPAGRPGGGSPARSALEALGQLIPSRGTDSGSGPQAVQTSAVVRGQSAAHGAAAGVAKGLSQSFPQSTAAAMSAASAAAAMPAVIPASSVAASASAAQAAPSRLEPLSETGTRPASAAPHLSLVHPVSASDAVVPDATPVAASTAASTAKSNAASPAVSNIAAEKPQADPVNVDAPVLSLNENGWPDREGWPDFVQTLQASGLLRQMLDRSQLDRVDSDGDGDSLFLTVAVRAYLDPAHAERAAQLFTASTGRKVSVKVQLGQADMTAQARADARARALQAQAEQAIRDDSFVQALQDSFGATVVPGSIRPLS
jgi:DNA polymerase-3 subunit gamma/tau